MLSKVLKILDNKHKKHCLLLLLIFVPVTILETIGIGSLPIFVVFITQPENIIQYININQFVEILNNLTLYERAIYGSAIISSIFILKAIIILGASYFESNLVKEINILNSSRLYKYYLYKPYYFHVENDPPKLIQNMNDVSRSTGIVFSLISLIKEFFLITVIVILLFISDPKTFSIVFGILSLPLIFFYVFFKKILKNKGQLARNYRRLSLKSLDQGFAGIKFTKLLSKEDFLHKSYKKNFSISSNQDMFLVFLGKVPRVLLEILAILTTLIIIMLFIRAGNNFNELLPLLTFIVVATVRLIPSFGNIVTSLNNIKFNTISLNNLYLALSNKRSDLLENNLFENSENCNDSLLSVNNVNFSYPGKNENVLNNLTFDINHNSIVGITGSSGSGKTTLVDIILGLLPVNKGSINNYGKNIYNNLKLWRDTIGYVPQNVNLIDDTIKNNICYGYEDNLVDLDLLNKSIKFANLEDLIESLPDKINTNIGYQGLKISGGQLQRIGIARALYQNPNLLVLDEATNALDIKTEKNLIQNLTQFKFNITIILISHRISVLKKCDQIIVIENGKIEFNGKYEKMPKLISE